ncbi:hypothetical protein OSB04_un001581 [Centaurea solstitialis]|uniref:Uncharacterized protein n=1 Tax=Centaurea solstitialis TaxID=347529 RepID=A0AA38VQR7_9ASTR|nr:hypothetical protein OSB04_un001581 [Centaurea solstitialis]
MERRGNCWARGSFGHVYVGFHSYVWPTADKLAVADINQSCGGKEVFFVEPTAPSTSNLEHNQIFGVLKNRLQGIIKGAKSVLIQMARVKLADFGMAKLIIKNNPWYPSAVDIWILDVQF